ncbi:putative toxin-antitoxin system antitoxin component (TIGR02293 family) [Chitinivorax tropicus]|uniref:Putative toxin-antitoxin system antitoxin component (TIGR02293 family) n=1 Tax=Chitinivorax tropicus TaxID=714531 RepID=A0A840MH00_9PROT|nr:antitoxin Xre/MbcA/ParS toxin-binding domain-containing protein [Chitinivorax tropicus]MBB5017670.1 putative toxin-antitoxin system antitoxin component (TIGR02293 family) [Chitinivorax tropicus]
MPQAKPFTFVAVEAQDDGDDYSRLSQLLAIPVNDELGLAEQISAGLPLAAVAMLTNAGIKRSEIISLVAPARTLQHRQSKGEPLNPEESERAVRLARVLTQAEVVFAEHEAAIAWLRRPLQRFNGKSPLDMLKTDVGCRLVENYLNEIDEGYAA